MALYSRTTWVNGVAPAINAPNLNNIETELVKVDAFTEKFTVQSNYQSYTPQIICSSGVAPNLGTGGSTWGLYTVLPGKFGPVCIGHANVLWGSPGGTSGGPGAGSIAGYYFSLPLACRTGADAGSTDFFIGSGMYGRAIGTHDSPITIFTLGNALPTVNGVTAPSWFQAVIGHYSTGGSDTIAVGLNAKLAIPHRHGLIPGSIAITAKAQPTASGVGIDGVYVTNVTNTTFDVRMDGASFIVTDGVTQTSNTGIGSYNARFNPSMYGKSIEATTIPAGRYIVNTATGNLGGTQSLCNINDGTSVTASPATNLTIGRLVANQPWNFYWTATRDGEGSSVILGPNVPVTFGVNQDHFEFAFAYPCLVS